MTKRKRLGVRLAGTMLVMALAAAWPPTSAEAGPLLCDPGGIDLTPGDSAAFACETVSRTFSPGGVSQLYSYDNFGAVFEFAFSNQLTFDTVLRQFTLFLTAFYIDPGDPGDFLTRIPAGFVPETFVTTFGNTWIYFYVEDLQEPGREEPQQGIEYAGAWLQDIKWFGDGIYIDPQVLHDKRGGGNFFGDNITVPGSFDPVETPCSNCTAPPSCEDCIDPVIVGSADDFSGTLIVDQVPEPLTMWLLTAGGAGIYVRARSRRLRRDQADQEPR